MSATDTAAGRLLLAGLGLATLGVLTQPGLTRQQGGEPTVAGQGPSFPTTTGGFGTSDSNDQMIAVTGIDVTGSSILYVIDTQNRQLAVYQANAGSASTMGLKFVAGRNIDLDLKVWGYNDKSEHSYRDMVDQFERKNR